jgi:hypothetical protein
MIITSIASIGEEEKTIEKEVCFSAPLPFPKLNRYINTSRAEITPYPFIT